MAGGLHLRTGSRRTMENHLLPCRTSCCRDNAVVRILSCRAVYSLVQAKVNIGAVPIPDLS